MEINSVVIEDTYAEAFPVWIAGAIITAATSSLAYEAAHDASGTGTLVFGSGAGAGIDYYLSPDESPDGRPGCAILVAHFNKKLLKDQLVQRLSECVLTTPTTAVFNGFPDATDKLPVKLHYFGDGYEYETKVHDRNVWVIPTMGGDFTIEEEIGCVQGFSGGNFLIMGTDQMAALTAAQAGVKVISDLKGAAAIFPIGAIGSGSKIGSKSYTFLKASTNDALCPTLKHKNPKSVVPDGVKAILEVVIIGVSDDKIRQAMAGGIRAACNVPGITHISAGNYGGTLGSFKFKLHEILSS